jgi:hypothetical protein
MKKRKISWGLILLSAGVILLLDNLGIIDFSWGSVWHYWPVILILSGINMLFSGNNSAIGTIIAILLTCIILAFLIYTGINYPSTTYRWYNNDEDTALQENNKNENTFTEEFSPGTHTAELNITGGASSYKLEGTTSNLFEARVRQAFGRYSLKKISRDSVDVLNFSMSEHGTWRMRGGKVTLKLNSLPLWNIHVKLGAGSTDFDLSSFKIQNLNFEGSAASFKVKLGALQNITNVTIKSGVSDIDISVPEIAGCQIRIKSGLSSKNFDGFSKQGDGVYATSNFTSSSKKVIININGGLSNFDVKRY